MQLSTSHNSISKHKSCFLITILSNALSFCASIFIATHSAKIITACKQQYYSTKSQVWLVWLAKSCCKMHTPYHTKCFTCNSTTKPANLVHQQLCETACRLYLIMWLPACQLNHVQLASKV